ncbi:chain length determinant protein EpsF [Aquitalea sp. USM4]|uniref:chain length determinant protein EpsF n=1 Tax=Aquitalea sp. USM4 TaxID=1590041 RepID=UPI001039AAF4|nr:chain length determinant protein EpsF [Aquitalea sp. USM4]QBJ79405.1 chain length determinant protein EpsF [Aquitalea sp. USM4]
MDIEQLLLILRARKKTIIKVWLSVLVLVVVASLVFPKTYKASTSLVLNFKGFDPVSGINLPAQLTPGYVPTQIDIISSKRVALRVVDLLKLDKSAALKDSFQEQTAGDGNFKDWIASMLLRKLDVVPSKDSNVLEITYKSNDPKYAATMANAFASAYQQLSVELKVEPSQQAQEYFAGEINRRKAIYEAAQRKLSQYQQENGIVNVDDHYDVENARLNDLSSQLVQAQSQAMEATSRRAQVRGGGNSSPDVTNNTLIQNLKASLATSQSKLAQLSEKLGTRHPDYLAAKADVDNLQAELDKQTHIASTAVGGSAQIYLQREGELRSAVAAQKSKVLDLNRKRDELAVLSRELDSAQEAFKSISARATQVNLDAQAVQSDVAVLNPATPPVAPWAPKLPLNVVLAAIAGALLGVVVALVQELSSRRLRSLNEVLALQLGPNLAVIDDFNRSELPLSGKKKRFAFFRSKKS